MNAITEHKHLLQTTTPIDHYARQIASEYDDEQHALWTFMQPAGVPCFNLGMLHEIRRSDKLLQVNRGQVHVDGVLRPVDFHIGASRSTGVFNYGGDLALFMLLIKTRDRDALLHYARLCIDTLYGRLTSFDTNVITISLLQGEALGGGFESALASHVIIAEAQSRMGFPEIMFNLFPGMGAYSILSRRIGARKAEEIILSGKIYTAQEMLDIGLIDAIAPIGKGIETVNAYMRANRHRLNGMRALFECRRHTNPITYTELSAIIDVWVDAAMRLGEKELKMMGRLVRSQLRQQQAIDNAAESSVLAPLAS